MVQQGGIRRLLFALVADAKIAAVATDRNSVFSCSVGCRFPSGVLRWLSGDLDCDSPGGILLLTPHRLYGGWPILRAVWICPFLQLPFRQKLVALPVGPICRGAVRKDLPCLLRRPIAFCALCCVRAYQERVAGQRE